MPSLKRRGQPDHVFLAAAKVGGILANNTYRAEFIYDNLMVQCNVLQAAYLAGVKKLLFLGSSCIYPKLAPQPLKEEYMLTGLLEPTNEPYAKSRRSRGSKYVRRVSFAVRMQFHFGDADESLWASNDNYDLDNSHVLPALIRKFHEAKLSGEPEVVLWGSGRPRREFLHVDDLADACYFLMQRYDEPGLINIGTGEDIEIIELARLVKKIVGYGGEIKHDLSKPDGTPRKLMDVSKLHKMNSEWPGSAWKVGSARVYEDFSNSL